VLRLHPHTGPAPQEPVALSTELSMPWSSYLQNGYKRNFPGAPVAKTSPSNAGGTGLIPGWGARIPHASWPKNQNMRQMQYGNKFSNDFKMIYILKKLKKIKYKFSLSALCSLMFEYLFIFRP
jgi:hypothetical protein